MNCPRCRQVFEGTLNDRLATLHLWAHPALPSADAYPELAVHGIHPNSSMDDVQEVFAETTAEKDAVEILRRVPSRLVADLFMAPLEDEEDADGS